MRDIFFLFWAGSSRPGRANLARFIRLTEVGKSAGHRLASSADLPTKASFFVNGTYRLVISREILPPHTSND